MAYNNGRENRKWLTSIPTGGFTIGQATLENILRKVPIHNLLVNKELFRLRRIFLRGFLICAIGEIDKSTCIGHFSNTL